MLKRNVISSIAQLLVYLATFSIMYWRFSLNRSIPNNQELFVSIFFLFVAMIIPEKIGAIMTGYAQDKETKEKDDRFTDLYNLLHDPTEIQIFDDVKEGLQYCLSTYSSAIMVKNTVLRYGQKKSINTAGPQLYTEWLLAKKKSIAKGKCAWKEIVSKHFDDHDPQIQIVKNASSGMSQYNRKFLDDNIYPIAQMTIFFFKGERREVILGWEYPQIDHGPCFLIRNKKIVDYFDKYFENYFTNVAKNDKI